MADIQKQGDSFREDSAEQFPAHRRPNVPGVHGILHDKPKYPGVKQPEIKGTDIVNWCYVGNEWSLAVIVNLSDKSASALSIVDKELMQ